LLKTAYQARYGKNVKDDVESDLSGKTKQCVYTSGIFSPLS
jgi:hypothetical protein